MIFTLHLLNYITMPQKHPLPYRGEVWVQKHVTPLSFRGNCLIALIQKNVKTSELTFLLYSKSPREYGKPRSKLETEFAKP